MKWFRSSRDTAAREQLDENERAIVEMTARLVRLEAVVEPYRRIEQKHERPAT